MRKVINADESEFNELMNIRYELMFRDKKEYTMSNAMYECIIAFKELKELKRSKEYRQYMARKEMEESKRKEK